MSNPEPAPDMSDYEMVTINDGPGLGAIIGAPLVVFMIAAVVYLFWRFW